MPSTQHHKGKKRPRAWHRGRAAGAKQVKALQAIEKAEQRHAKAEAANVAQKLMHMEEVDMWTGIQHAAPPAGLAWFDHNNERRWWQWLTRRSSTTGRSGRAAS